MQSSNEILELLYTKLPEYITEILHMTPNSKGMFTCPTKLHPDSDPSCHIVTYNTQVCKCFGCGKAFNIFGFAHYVEGYPLEGADFWKVTVPELCKKFNIPYEPEELSQDDKEKYMRLRSYKDATAYITAIPENKEALVYKYLDERKWDHKILGDVEIGVVEDYAKYIEHMKSLGWSKAFMDIAELSNKNLFNKDNLIFVVNDDQGRPVGFACRNMKYKKNDTNTSKWMNSSSSIIYQKGNILYNFDRAKAYGTPLWIVEGYGDCAYMYHLGIKNVAAIGAATLVDNENMSHIELLQKYKINDIILCLDNDEGGNIGTAASLEKLAAYRSFKVRICKVSEYDDPETFIRHKGVEEFKKLPICSPFEYKLGIYPHDYDTTKISQEMIPYICMEKSPIIQYQMIDNLHKRTGIDKVAIENEVKVTTSETDFQRHIQFQEYQQKLYKDIKRSKNIHDLEVKLNVRLDDINKYIVQESDISSGIEVYNERIREIETKFFKDKEPAFNLGKFNLMNNALEGIPKSAALIGMAGIPNIGKTSFLRCLSMEMIYSNDDIFIIFMSIDDNLEKIVAAMISIMTSLPITNVSRAASQIENDKAKLFVCKRGWERFKGLTDKLVIKDARDGNSVAALENHIKYYRKLYPNKKIILILDNYYKLSDMSGAHDQGKYNDSINRMKDLSTIHDVPILATMELRKGTSYSAKPTTQDVKETNSIEYNCDALWMLHQEYHLDKKTQWIIADKENDVIIKRPIVELMVQKNKLGDYKGSLFFKFYTDKSMFDEVAESELAKKGMPTSALNSVSFLNSEESMYLGSGIPGDMKNAE